VDKESGSEASEEKAYQYVRCVEMETNASEPLMRCRKKIIDDVKTCVLALYREQSGSCLPADRTASGIKAA